MMNLFEIGVNIIEDLIIVSFLTIYFGCKYTGMKAIVGFIIGVVSMSLCVTFVNSIYVYEAFWGMGFILLYFLYCFIFLKGDVYTKLFIAGFFNCIVYSIAVFSQICVSILLNDNTYQILNMSMERIVVIAVSKVLLVIACIVLLRFRFENIARRSNTVLFILMPIITEISTVGIMQVFLKHNDLKEELLLATAGIILNNALIYYVVIKISRNIEIETENALLKQKLDNDKKNAENIKELYNKSCAIRHDVLIHFDAILGLLNKGADAVRDYIQDITHRYLYTIRNMVNTGNDCFDGLVNAKIALCDRYGIFSEVHVTNGTLEILRHDEIAVIFGNLFDNAIEASRLSGEKYIRLDVQMQDQYLSISMENSVDSTVLAGNKKLETTKEDKELHGLGLKNIKDLVERHHGMINFSERGGCFICDILLKGD